MACSRRENLDGEPTATVDCARRPDDPVRNWRGRRPGPGRASRRQRRPERHGYAACRTRRLLSRHGSLVACLARRRGAPRRGPVARTIVGILHVGAASTVAVLAAASPAAVGFTWVTTRRGLPTSASVGLVGGLAGAGVAARGAGAVEWGGLAGGRPVGVLGVLIGILLAPFLAALVAGTLDQVARWVALRLPRAARREVHGGLWIASAAVAVADGTNDGQKAMGLLTVVVSGAASLDAAGGIAPLARVGCAVILAVAT